MTGRRGRSGRDVQAPGAARRRPPVAGGRNPGARSAGRSGSRAALSRRRRAGTAAAGGFGRGPAWRPAAGGGRCAGQRAGGQENTGPRNAGCVGTETPARPGHARPGAADPRRLGSRPRAGGDRPGIPRLPRAGRTRDRCCTPTHMIFPMRCIAVATKTVIRDTGPSAPERRTIDVWTQAGRQEPPVRPRVGGERGNFDGRGRSTKKRVRRRSDRGRV